MTEWNIYIQTSTNAPQKRERQYGVVAVKADKLRSFKGIGHGKMTWHHANLKALWWALEQFDENVTVRVHSEDTYFITTLDPETDALQKLADRNFELKNGKKAADAALWEAMWKKRQSVRFIAVPGPHAYKDCLMEEFERRSKNGGE